jgi:hypothetical protein
MVSSDYDGQRILVVGLLYPLRSNLLGSGTVCDVSSSEH